MERKQRTEIAEQYDTVTQKAKLI